MERVIKMQILELKSFIAIVSFSREGMLTGIYSEHEPSHIHGFTPRTEKIFKHMGCTHSLDIIEDTSSLLIFLSYLEIISSVFLFNFHPSLRQLKKSRNGFTGCIKKWQLNCGIFLFFFSIVYTFEFLEPVFKLAMPCPVTEQKTLKVSLL